MGPNKVKITLPDGETRDIQADNIVTTGSMPSSIPGVQISGKE